jgi:hypothetical protein
LAQVAVSSRLDRPVDDRYDHILGLPDADITLVEYGVYDCPHCRWTSTRGCTWPARAPWPASASRCRFSSPEKHFPAPRISRPRKIAVFAASVLSATIGVAVLWNAGHADAE